MRVRKRHKYVAGFMGFFRLLEVAGGAKGIPANGENGGTSGGVEERTGRGSDLLTG